MEGRPKRVVIIGGVAGGMSTATRLRRLDAAASITVLERSGHVSFANCGLPYFVGGLIEEEEDLTLQTPEQLFDRFRLDVRVDSEVVAIDRAAHTVMVRSTLTGRRWSGYDKLVLSMGAAPVRPPIPGYERVRTLRTVEDAARLASDVGAAPKTAVVIGAGFIGLEMAENLVGQGIGDHRRSHPPGAAAARSGDGGPGRRRAGGPRGPSRPERPWRRWRANGHPGRRPGPPGRPGGRRHRRPPRRPAGPAAGLDLGPSGGMAVNEVNQTNDADIYAVGDAVEKADAISHATSLIALANVANRQGRRVADHIAGRPSHPVDSLGTAIVKVFDLVAATVGWSERRLRAAGRPYRSIHSHPFDHATYYPGATRMAAKLIFDPNDGTILGAQIVGRNGVDKRIDVIATAMAGGMTAGARRPGARLCAAVLLGQGPRQHARLHGRERAERRLRHRGPRRPRRPGRRRLAPRRRAHRGRARRRGHPGLGEHPRRLAPGPPGHARDRPSSCIARWASEATPPPRCCTSWVSRPAISTADTRPGRHQCGLADGERGRTRP